VNERTIHTALGRRVVLSAEVDDPVLDWGAHRVATHLVAVGGDVQDGSGIALGCILCAFRADGDGFVLAEPDFSAPRDPAVPDRFVPGITRALRLAYEQHRVHASFPDAPPLRENLFHNMQVSVVAGWDLLAHVFAHRSPSVGSHTGWTIHRDDKDLGADREVAVRDVIERRPVLARFLSWAHGTAVRCSYGELYVYVQDGARRLSPSTGSYLSERLTDTKTVPFDPVAHASFVARLRASPELGSSLHLRIAEETFSSRSVARALARDIHRHVAADRLYDLAFVRRLRTFLRQSRDAVALAEIERAGMLEPSEAKAFLDRTRASIEAGKVPPR
jgi:hypothetical protein